jgi:hypothetical protein
MQVAGGLAIIAGLVTMVASNCLRTFLLGWALFLGGIVAVAVGFA